MVNILNVFARVRNIFFQHQSTIFLGVASIVMILAHIYTTYNVSKSIRLNILQTTASLSHLIDPNNVRSLQGNDQDETNPVYRYYKTQLQHIKEINPDIKFIYLMRQTPQGVIFLLDSVEEGGVDYSPPGQQYQEASAKLIKTFTNGTSEIEIEGDRWGYWVSAFAPIYDDMTGEIVGVVGIDVDFYTEYLLPILGYNLFVFTVFALILTMMILNRQNSIVLNKILKEKNMILHVTSHEVRTPLTKIRWSSEILLDDTHTKLDPEVFEMVKQTYISTITMIERINILNYSVAIQDAQIPEFTDIEILQLYKKIATQFSLLAKLQQVTFIYSGDWNKQIIVNGNDKWIEIVCVTLLLNLLMYADPQTNITISIAADSSTMTCTFEGVGAVLQKQDIDNLFTGIHGNVKLTSHTEATGMGLYLIPKLLAYMNGSVRVEAENNVTRFILTMPVVTT